MATGRALAGTGLVKAGYAVTVAGLALGVVALLPLVTSWELPSLFWALAMLLGVGLALILVGLFVEGRQRSRLQRSGRLGTSRRTA